MSARRDSTRALPRILPFDSRARIARALEGCSSRERAVLALVLFERLSAAEAADALGIPAAEVERVYGDLMRTMDVALEGDGRTRRRPRPAEAPVAYRKAS